MANILIIEDDPFFRDDLEYFISDTDNHNIQTIKGVSDFLKMKGSFKKYDHVFLDLMMRKEEQLNNGDEFSAGELLYEIFRQENQHARIFIISAMKVSELKSKILEDPFVTFINKPVMDVGNLIETCLAKQ